MSWGSTATLGVEEELMLLDAETLSQRPVSSEVIARVRAERGLVKHELFESIVELNSGICSSVAEAVAVLGDLRDEVARVAADLGCTIAACGSHPFDDPRAQRIADEPHYRAVVEQNGAAARRQGVQGLHVHVGMPDAATCLRALEAMLPWLPLVLALSANSPFFEGAATGMRSTRAEILGLLPFSGAPPRFDSWRDWERTVARLHDGGAIDSYTALHWDIRPHPNYGTLEVRMPDQPTDLARTRGLVELLRALALWALEQPVPADDRPVYARNRFAAALRGAAAVFVHPERAEQVPASALYRELAERLGVDPLDPELSEADDQLAFADPRDAAADVVRRSLRSRG